MSKVCAQTARFPSCCGAAILHNFAPGASEGEEVLTKKKVKYMSKYRTLVAITASYQLLSEKKLKILGFKKKCVWMNGNSKLTLWVLKKATPPKKKRK